MLLAGGRRRLVSGLGGAKLDREREASDGLRVAAYCCGEGIEVWIRALGVCGCGGCLLLEFLVLHVCCYRCMLIRCMQAGQSSRASEWIEGVIVVKIE